MQEQQADLGQRVFAAHNVEAEGGGEWAASVTIVVVVAAAAAAAAAAADRTQ